MRCFDFGQNVYLERRDSSQLSTLIQSCRYIKSDDVLEYCRNRNEVTRETVHAEIRAGTLKSSGIVTQGNLIEFVTNTNHR